MTQTLAHLQLVQPEHRIFWTARASGQPVANDKILRRFFVRYARDYARQFAWRSPDVSPFGLLIAELLLVQTKAKDVAEIWPQLMAGYPSAERLARAQTHALTKLLKPLGLQNHRARALKSVASAIVDRFDGRLPTSLPDLLSLPYVGLYVACAVACFSYGDRVPIVDANVLRIFGRLAGFEPGSELRRSPKVWNAVWAVLPRKNFVQHNYGVLDFAAEICKPRLPRCQSCALNNICAYARTDVNVLVTGEITEGHSRGISRLE